MHMFWNLFLDTASKHSFASSGHALRCFRGRPTAGPSRDSADLRRTTVNPLPRRFLRSLPVAAPAIAPRADSAAAFRLARRLSLVN